MKERKKKCVFTILTFIKKIKIKQKKNEKKRAIHVGASKAFIIHLHLLLSRRQSSYHHLLPPRLPPPYPPSVRRP